MSTDLPFRIALVVLYALVWVVRGPYRLRDDKASATREGSVILTLRNIFGPAMILAALAYAIYPPLMQWSSLELALGWRWVGVGLGLVVILWLIWTHRHLGKHWSPTLRILNQHTLITTGPYRWIRHPVYTAFLMSVLVAFLLSANWFVLLTGGLAFLVIAVRTVREEAMLIEAFGEQYRDYMKHTGRFWPGLLQNK